MAFDPRAATAAYIDALGAEKLARAADYTAGNHWLLLWNLVAAGLAAWLLIRSGLLDGISARLKRRGFFVRHWLICAANFLLLAVLALPWTLYADWWREVQYGRSSQPLADYVGQALLATGVSAALSALFFVGVYALMRRAGRAWWLWCGGLTAAALTVFLLISPVVLEPLFNDFRPVPPGDVRDSIAQIAQRAQVPEDRIFVYDGSRQSNNFTANVSGLGGSARIAISDVAFRGASLDEVTAVTAHEAGHYSLGHVWQRVALLAGLALAFFWLANRLFPRFAGLLGSRATLDDPVGLPVLGFMMSLFLVLTEPVQNAVIRSAENAADRYSLETVNLPDAMATALVKTAEYRDPRPGAWQERLFYTHPSVERRVLACMEWKARRQVQ